MRIFGLVRRPAGRCVGAVALAALAAAVLPTTPTAAEPGGVGFEATALPFPAADAVHDPVRDLVYASVPAATPAVGNHVVAVDPATGAVVRRVWVGSEPSALALAGDASVLHVGLDGAHAVARVDVATFTLVDQTPLTVTIPAPDGHTTLPAHVDDLVAAPGRPGTVLASLRGQAGSLRHLGVAAVADGVVLPVATPSHIGPTRLAASADATTFYGVSRSQLHTLALGSDGVRVTQTRPQVFDSSNNDIELHDGLIYATGGAVVDPTSGTEVGRYRPRPESSPGGPIEPVGDRTYILGHDGLHAYSRREFTPLATLALPPTSGQLPGALVATGAGLAGVAGDGTLYLFTPSALPPPPPPVAEPADGADPWATLHATRLGVVATDVVYDPVRQRVYASVPSLAPTHGNRVVALDPGTGAVEQSVWVGSEPGPLALADDASALYVGLSGANAVVRVDPASLTVVARTPLALAQPAHTGPVWATDLVVQPGNPNVVVVATHSTPRSPGHQGVVAIDDGTLRPVVTPGHTGPHALAAGADASTFYGVSASTPPYLYTLTLADDGVRVAATGAGTGARGSVELVDGLLHSSSGAVIDPATSTTVGTYGDGGVPRPVGDRTYVLHPGGLTTYHRSRFAPLAHVDLPAGTTAPARALVATDAGLLGVSGTGAVHLFTPAPVDVPPPPPARLARLDLQTVRPPVRATDVVFDPARDLVYAAVPSADPGYGNQVVALDPANGAVRRAVWVGSEPGSLALSDDASALYVGLRGTSDLVRIDPARFAVAERTRLRVRTALHDGPAFVEDLEVQPGHADVVVASLSTAGAAPNHVAVVAVDDGTIRPEMTALGTWPRALSRGPDAATFYGYQNRSSSRRLYTLVLTDGGVRLTATAEGVLSGFDHTITFADGRLYSSSGTVVDPATNEVLGAYGGGGPGAPLGVAVEPGAAGDQTFWWAPDGLYSFSRTAFTPTARLAVPVGSGRVTARLAATSTGLAALNRDGTLYLLTSPNPRPNPPTFSDVAGHAHAGAILAVAAAGVAAGHPDGTFRPDLAVTRGQMATFLTRALRLAPQPAQFRDTAGHAHGDAIGAIAAAGIATGRGDGTFRPDDPVTREQMATFLTRALQLAPADRPAPFVDVAGVHAGAVASLYTAGVTGGTGNDRFSPHRPVTRGQMATFLARSLGLVPRLEVPPR